MRLKYVVYFLALLSIVGWGPMEIYTPAVTYTQVPGSETWINKQIKAISAQAPNLDQQVLRLSLTAYHKAVQQGLSNKPVLTIIDYSKPSTERRLWVVNIETGQVLFNTLVAHGKNSGSLNATSFSNKPNSLKSSYGVFVTAETYIGHDGYSLRIKGMEPGINDNVYNRHVIFHGARYVSEAIAKAKGLIGRSWGCMAVSEDVIHPIIDTIKDKTVVFAYYPDETWLKTSVFLT